MITAMRSFRTTKRLPLLRQAQPHASIRAQVEMAQGERTQINVHLSRVSRKAFVDEAQIEKFSDFIGRFPTVTLSSEDIQLLRGSPSLRRRFFELVLSFGDPFYLETLRKYHNTLKHRNALLKLDDPRPQLPTFDTQLAGYASVLAKLRKIPSSNSKGTTGFYNGIALADSETPSIFYSPSKPADSEEFYSLLQANLDRDIYSGTTNIGRTGTIFPSNSTKTPPSNTPRKGSNAPWFALGSPNSPISRKSPAPPSCWPTTSW